MKHKIQEALYLLEYGVVRVLFAVVGRVPLPALELMAGGIGNLAYLVLSRKRKIALENLRLAFGHEKSEKELGRIAKKSMQQLILVFLELTHLVRSGIDYEQMCTISAEEKKRLHDATSRGNGAIFLTAHMANWEFLVLLFGKWFSDLSVIGRPVKNRYLFDYIRRIRGLTGAHHIDKDEAVRETVRVLRRGGMLGMLIDQRAGEAGVEVPFFGHPANTTGLPALMKKKFNCALLVVLCVREKAGKFRVVIPDEIPWIEDAKDFRNLTRTVAAYNKSLEGFVRQHPEQWLWYHRRWRL